MINEKQKRVFLSYAREDAASARRLRADLTALGVDIWFDEISLLPGQNWHLEIQQAIRSADFFVLILSEFSVTKRGVVQSELREALDVMREMPEGAVFIVPVRIEPVEPDHKLLRTIHRVDLFDNWEEGVRRIGLTLFGKSCPSAQSVEVINIAQLVESVVETIARNDLSTQIKVSGISEASFITADRSVIKIVLCELLANALLDAAPDVDGKTPVLVDIQSTPETAVLQIRSRITAIAQFSDSLTISNSPGSLRLARNAVIQCGGDLKAAVHNTTDSEQHFVVTLTFPRALPKESVLSVENSRVKGSEDIGKTVVNLPRILVLSFLGILIVVLGSLWIRNKQGEVTIPNKPGEVTIPGKQEELTSTPEPQTSRLNPPDTTSNNQASEINFNLYPNAVRSDGARSTINSTSRAQVLRLYLLLMADQYQSYSCKLFTEDRKILLATSDLPVSIQDRSNSAVIVKLPLQGLPSGDYHIELMGKNNKEIQVIAIYYFRLVSR